jgi:hypothetical protein
MPDDARPRVYVHLQGRSLQAMARGLGLTAGDLAELCGRHRTDVSRLFSAIQPGGLLDKLAAAIFAEAERQAGEDDGDYGD